MWSGARGGPEINHLKYGSGEESGDLGRQRYGTHPLNRVGSPSSDYGGKNRKGVSFADIPVAQRARSHSPPPTPRHTGGHEGNPTVRHI